MKTFLKIIGVLFLVIIALMIILPLFFKDDLVNLAKEKANEQLNAELQFEDFGVNLFSNFPDITLNAEKISIINKEPFAGDTLAWINDLEITVDLWSVITGDQIIIEGVTAHEPDIFVFVAQDGSANYEIFKETEETDTASNPMKFDLQGYEIIKADIAYIDNASGMSVFLKNMNHSGRGNFSAETFELTTETKVEELTYEMSGVKYLNKVTADLEMQLEADMPQQKFTLLDNKLLINNLPLEFEGYVRLLEEATEMDLKFSSPEAKLTEIISLIPAIYAENFEDLQSSGELKFNGFARGRMTEEEIPQFKIDLNVNNGSLKNLDMPSAIENININMTIENSGSTIETVVVNIEQFSFNMSGEPFVGNLLVRNFETGPNFKAKLRGKINLTELNNAMKMENVEQLSGIINADFSASGNLANMEANRASEKINADGSLSFSNIVYKTDETPELKVSSGNLTFTPRQINLNNFSSSFGESDLRASGELTNVFSYFLSDGILNGNLTLNSNYLNLNPFLSEDETAAATEERSNIQKVEIPSNINFTASAKFNTLVFDNLEMKNVTGKINVKNSRVNLENLRSELLDGVLTATGYYEVADNGNPRISFNLDVNNFKIKETYEKFVTVQKFAPMAKYIGGNFGAYLSLSTPLNEQMEPIWNEFNSSGTLKLNRAEIKDFKPFDVLGDRLKINELKNPVITNVNPSYKIQNGEFTLSPFSYEVGNYTATLSGSNRIDGTLNYKMGIDIPAANLKNNANQAISNLLNTDVDLVKENTVKVAALIGGTINDPNVSVKAGDIVSDTKEQITETIKSEAKEKIEETKAEVKDTVESVVEEKVDTVKKEVEKKVKDKLKDLFK